VHGDACLDGIVNSAALQAPQRACGVASLLGQAYRFDFQELIQIGAPKMVQVVQCQVKMLLLLRAAVLSLILLCGKNDVAAANGTNDKNDSDLTIVVLILIFVVMVFVNSRIQRSFFAWANRVLPPIVFKVIIWAIIAFFAVSALLIFGYLMTRKT
jgi:hypothetical protein